MPLNPLPFRLQAAGRDSVVLVGFESVSYRVDGVLTLAEDGVTLEWTATRTTEQVSFDRIGTDVDELPPEWLQLPFERIAGAWLIGRWWWPRLELRARGLEDFEGVPAARGVTLSLSIQRRDRALARAIVSEIESRAAAAVPTFEGRRRLGTTEAE